MSWLYNAIAGGVGGNGGQGAIALPLDPPPTYSISASAGGPPASTAAVGGGGQLPRGVKGRLPRPPPLDLPALNMIRGKRVILASASPRRKQLLSQIGLTDIEVIPSSFAENLDKSRYEAFEYVLETAIQKCLEVYKREINNQVKGEPAIVLSADTVIVSYTGEIMEKPRSKEGHLAMLKALRDGPPHKVCTAVVAMAPLETLVHPGYAQENHVEETIVTFDPMVTDDLLEAYVKTREGADKAGGYAIQGAGSILVKKIEGTFDNVVGMPLRGTLKVIERVLSNDEMIEEGEEEEEEEARGGGA